MREVIEAGLQPDKIERVIVAGDRALAVTEPARLNDPKYKEPASVVYSLVRQDGRWAVHDIDLEDEEGLREEIRRFKESTGIGLIESRVLRQEFVRLLADAVAARKRAGGDVPDGWDTPEFVPAIIERLKTESPRLLQVTPDQEQRLVAGKYDDAEATRSVKNSIKVLGDHEAELPLLHRYLLDRFEAGKLSGARLELARRMMAGLVESLARVFRGGKAVGVEPGGADPDRAR